MLLLLQILKYFKSEKGTLYVLKIYSVIVNIYAE